MSSSGQSDSRWVTRVARREINGRRVNEAIERGRRGDGPATFVCECGHIGCSTTVTLSLGDYEAVRTSFVRFLVVPGHELPPVDEVVERRDGYLVVVKQGDAGVMAAQADERTADA